MMHRWSWIVLTLFVIGFAGLPLRAQERTGRPEPDAASGVNLRRTVTVDVVARTKDAVVNVSTTKTIARRVNPFGNDPFWQQFDVGQVARVPANSLGSGFIIHKDGYVVTNNHVIDHARQIDVELSDGRKLPADLVSSDSEADLAILKITDPKGQAFPVLQLGDSSDLMIGEPVIAVGNPFGYSHSVSTGIVSAIHRDLKDSKNGTLLGDLIQTDAAINPGNSGGPLLNAYAQVIAINTAIRSDAQNIGFAIQVNKLRDLIPELMNPAQVNKVDVPLKLAEERKISEPATVTSSVYEAGAPHVPVVSIAGQATTDIISAYATMLHAKAGESVELRFADGKTTSVVAKAVPLPDAILRAKQRLGITVEVLTPMLAERYKLSREDGMFVVEVDKDSIAAKAGMQAGDIIFQLGHYRVATLDDFAALLQRLPDTGRVRIGVIRGEQMGFGILQL